MGWGHVQHFVEDEVVQKISDKTSRELRRDLSNHMLSWICLPMYCLGS